jgi:hypothetical protein
MFNLARKGFPNAADFLSQRPNFSAELTEKNLVKSSLSLFTELKNRDDISLLLEGKK